MDITRQVCMFSHPQLSERIYLPTYVRTLTLRVNAVWQTGPASRADTYTPLVKCACFLTHCLQSGYEYPASEGTCGLTHRIQSS